MLYDPKVKEETPKKETMKVFQRLKSIKQALFLKKNPHKGIK